VSKKRWPGKPAFTSPGRDVGGNGNPCMLKSVTLIFMSPKLQLAWKWGRQA